MATILDGLNAISQAVGGTGEAESNLEALNQISEALGGSADAENNADAIANIAENASGGGGGGDFQKATVTLYYDKTGTSPMLIKEQPIAEIDDGDADIPAAIVVHNVIVDNKSPKQVPIPLYKGKCVIRAASQDYTISGNCADNGDGSFTISGDCSITYHN